MFEFSESIPFNFVRSDPCPHPRDTTRQAGGNGSAERTSALQRGRSQGSSAPRTATASGEPQPGSVHTQEDGRRGARLEGRLVRRREEHSENPPSSSAGGRVPETRDREPTGNRTPQEQGPGIGGPVCCPGEALLWQQSEYPAGTVKKLFARGSLRGLNPEALCGEAPKGQPMIRRETLEAVHGEAPKGQPRNHGCRAKQLETKPRGKE